MTRPRYIQHVEDAFGNAIQGAAVTLLVVDTNTPVTNLTSDKEGLVPLAQPLESNNAGDASAYLPQGMTFDVQVVYAGVTTLYADIEIPHRPEDTVTWTGTGVLSNKTLDGPIITGTLSLSGVSVSGGTFSGAVLAAPAITAGSWGTPTLVGTVASDIGPIAKAVQFAAMSGTALVLTTAYQTVAGTGPGGSCGVTLTTGVWRVTGVFDFLMDTLDVGQGLLGHLAISSGSLTIANGLDAFFGPNQDQARQTIARDWIVTVTSATAILVLQAKKLGGTGGSTVQGNTSIEATNA